MAITIEVITDELCNSAVKSAPTAKSKKGFSNVAKNSRTCSRSEKYAMALLIMESPANSMPNPAAMPPACCHLSFLANVRINAPTPAKAANITEVETVFLPKRPSATNCPVTVVPTLAPKITAAACVSVKIPAFTNPITITVVALEL